MNMADQQTSPVQNRLEQQLAATFAPAHLDVVNESGQHNVPKGSETHFRVTLVADAFEDQRLLQRHRSVHRALADELAGPVHALALHTYTPAEWAERQATPTSPPCYGGG